MIISRIIRRAVASLTIPGGQEFHFPHLFLKFRSIFLIFPQTSLIFFLILVLRVGESPTREGPGYATDYTVDTITSELFLRNLNIGLYDKLLKIISKNSEIHYQRFSV